MRQSLLATPGAARGDMVVSKRCAKVLGDGHEHAYALPVALVCLAIVGEQIMLFKMDTGKDIGGHCQAEEQVTDRHAWCGPKGEEKAHHHGVTHQTVQCWCFEN